MRPFLSPAGLARFLELRSLGLVRSLSSSEAVFAQHRLGRLSPRDRVLAGYRCGTRSILSGPFLPESFLNPAGN